MDRMDELAEIFADLGFAVAESMDTAQRGMGLDWPTSLELILRSAALARQVPGAIVRRPARRAAAAWRSS